MLTPPSQPAAAASAGTRAAGAPAAAAAAAAALVAVAAAVAAAAGAGASVRLPVSGLRCALRPPINGEKAPPSLSLLGVVGDRGAAAAALGGRVAAANSAAPRFSVAVADVSVCEAAAGVAMVFCPAGFGAVAAILPPEAADEIPVNL